MEILLFGFIVWFVCAFAGMSIASSKGQGGCAGFALGFLLGPIGVIIVACLPPTQRVAARAAQIASQAELGAQQVCPHCRSLIPALATVCRFCQRDVPAPVEAQWQTMKQLTCEHDRVPVDMMLDKCSRCGIPMPKSFR